MRRLFLAVGFQAWVILISAGMAAAEEVVPTPLAPREYAIQKLRASGSSPQFIEFIERTYRPEDRDKIVEMNVLGFLGKADYSGHYSRRAIRKCREFLKKNRVRLRRAEVATGVPKEVIAALLWVETKHGKVMGKYPVTSVYFSLLQADHPEVLKTTLAALDSRAPAGLGEFKKRVIDQSIAKSNWANHELLSLDAIQTKDPARLPKLVGSYAGAFGVPQFIPSSYMQWAQATQASATPDLFRMEDAIQSVGNYLKANGWRRSDPASQQKALLHYNHAQGYVDVILRIARAMKT